VKGGRRQLCSAAMASHKKLHQPDMGMPGIHRHKAGRISVRWVQG